MKKKTYSIYNMYLVGATVYIDGETEAIVRDRCGEGGTYFFPYPHYKLDIVGPEGATNVVVHADRVRLTKT